MDDDNEKISLFSLDYGNKKRSTPESVRGRMESDSMNNYMVMEEDAESDIFTKDKCESFSAKQESDDTRYQMDERVNLREELSKHRNLVVEDEILSENGSSTYSKRRLHSKKSIWKNFMALCIGLMFAFMSFMPLRNIQTSLYPYKDLANISLASMYFAFAIGCLFSSWISQNARPKGIVLTAMFGHVMYAATNIYPSFMTLIPAACFFGFFHAPLWSTQELLIASYGARYTALTRICIEKSIQQFQGVFLIFCHAAQILGNLLESAILHAGDAAANDNVTKIHSVYDHYHPLHIKNITDYSNDLVFIGPFGYHVEPKMDYPNNKIDYESVVKFVFLILSAIGMTVICICFNKPDIIINKKKASMKDKVCDLACFLRTKTFFFLALLMTFSGMQQAVVICNVTKLFGTKTLGLSMVGYMMMCYGTCQLIILLIVEKLQGRLKPVVAILKAFIITLGLLVTLYVWEPSATSLYKILGYISLWGAVDGLWQSQIQSILVTSAGRKEAAVVCYRILQSLGLVAVFLMDIWLTLLLQICVLGAILVFGVIMYMILEVIQTPLYTIDPPPISV